MHLLISACSSCYSVGVLLQAGLAVTTHAHVYSGPLLCVMFTKELGVGSWGGRRAQQSHPAMAGIQGGM